VHADTLCLLAHVLPALADKLDIPCRRGLDGGREGRDAPGVAETERPVLEAEGGVVDAAGGTGVADAGAFAPTDAGDNADFFVLAEAGEGGVGFFIGGCPFFVGRRGCSC